MSPVTSLSQRLGLAAASYELVAAIPSVLTYFGSDKQRTWDAISLHEQNLQSILLKYLNSREDVTVYGKQSADAKLRVPVISFSVKGQSSQQIAEKVEACSNFGIRWGHVYAKRMVDDILGLKIDGIIRVSMVHYNTGICDFHFCFQVKHFSCLLKIQRRKSKDWYKSSTRSFHHHQIRTNPQVEICANAILVLSDIPGHQNYDGNLIE